MKLFASIAAAWRRGVAAVDYYFSDDRIVDKYVQAGARFGDSVSYLYMGECIGFKRQLRKWQRWEKRYAELGYQTIAIDDFITHGGYGRPIDHLLRQPQPAGTPVRYHAEIYRQHYLGRYENTVNTAALLDGTSDAEFGYHTLPSTKEDSATGST